jgi:ATP-dependent RNA helicase DeaD
VVIGTPPPARPIRRGTIRLGHVQTLVLDEADEMHRYGFIDDIEDILKPCRASGRRCSSRQR